MGLDVDWPSVGEKNTWGVGVKFPKGGNKFGASSCYEDGIKFDSKLEHAVYKILKLREAAGEISDIKVHETVRITDRCTHCKRSATNWKIDFNCFNHKSGKRLYVEAKGKSNASYMQKKKELKAANALHLEVWKGTYQKPYLAEEIIPTYNAEQEPQ